MAIPGNVELKLSNGAWHRSPESQVEAALEELGTSANSEFGSFYTKYWGPFRSEHTGMELLDIVEQAENVLTNTRAVRDEYSFPSRFVVVTSPSAGSVVVYDINTNNLYDVDFEGGDELLLSGKLAPRYTSWNDFISQYFG